MQLHTVEAFFIEPLKRYFEKDPKDGAEEHIVKTLEGTEPRVLEAAVEWIKSNRQAQSSFPSPKECFAAVQAVGSAEKRSEARSAFHDDMSYGQKLKAFMESSKRDNYPVIQKGTPEWAEWEIYFLAMDNQVQYPIMRSRDSWTVPSRLPSQFDPGYDWNRGDKLLRERSKQEAEADAPERRRFVQEQLTRAGIR